MSNDNKNEEKKTGPPPTTFGYKKNCEDWEGKDGKEQSPIDLREEDSTVAEHNLYMHLALTDHLLTGLILNDVGNTLVSAGPFSKLRAANVLGYVYEYEALQFHFHAPTEHTINGKMYDLELHIVHQMTPDSLLRMKTHRDLAVVGIMFKLDDKPTAKPNAFLDALKLDKVGSEIQLNMHELLSPYLSDMASFYSYKGSLTTPPCTESVNWYVIEKPLTITKKQLDYFNSRWKDNQEYACGCGNNRPVQPRNDRLIKRSTNCIIMSRSADAQMMDGVENDGAPPSLEPEEVKMDLPEVKFGSTYEDFSVFSQSSKRSIEGLTHKLDDHTLKELGIDKKESIDSHGAMDKLHQMESSPPGKSPFNQMKSH